MLMFVAIASVGGLLGALFNLLVKHLNTLRVRHVNKSSFRRVAEVTVLALLTGTVTVISRCTPIKASSSEIFIS